MNGDWLMALDAGGSFIKYAAVDASGKTEDGVRQLPVDSGSSSEAILSAYAGAVSALMEEAETRGRLPLGLGIATPGPFDYQNGISLMTHKFAGIYGMDLRKELTMRAGLPERMKIAFIHDVNAFLLGEYRLGAAGGYRCAAAVTLGTGVGFACIRDGSLLVNDMGSPCISLYRTSWGGGILEDAVSARGVVNAYASRHPGDSDALRMDARSVSQLARQGDRDAAAAFEQLGHALGSALVGVLARFGAQCLILGGQISRSYKLFEAPLLKALAAAPSLEKVCVAEYPENSALFGAACAALAYVEEGGPGGGIVRYERMA